MDDFRAQLDKAQRKMENELSKIVRGAAISCFNTIIKEEVVDTGRLRGNWQASINVPVKGVLFTNVPVGTGITSYTQDTAGSTKDYTLKDVLYLTNNLPYALPIENGHSARKGAGKVKSAVVRAKYALKLKLGDA